MSSKLVSIRKISSLQPLQEIAGAALADIDGWHSVVRSGEVDVGDSVVYFANGSWLPEGDQRWSMLMKSGVREFEGVRGVPVRTIKLKSHASQGLALPLRLFPELEIMDQGADLAKFLNVRKWVPPVPGPLLGPALGAVPAFVKFLKLDSAQDQIEQIFTQHANSHWERSRKIDGYPVIFYNNSRVASFGVCVGDRELKICSENSENPAVKCFLTSGVGFALTQTGNIVLHGELAGPLIKGNQQSLETAHFYIFGIWSCDAARWMTLEERARTLAKLYEKGVDRQQVSLVPAVGEPGSLQSLGIKSVQDLVAAAVSEGPEVEGLVFKTTDGTYGFKIANPNYIEKFN